MVRTVNMMFWPFFDTPGHLWVHNRDLLLLGLGQNPELTMKFFCGLDVICATFYQGNMCKMCHVTHLLT
jgi:hypothetical protein